LLFENQKTRTETLILLQQKGNVMEKQLWPVTTIVTHFGPHLDEITAIFLLRKFGEELFPGISTAEVIFWKTVETFDGASAQAWLERNQYLLVGIGGGIFDEHGSGAKDRIEGECTATLVAKYLGVNELPELPFILNFVLKTDTGPAEHPWDIAAMVKTINKANPDSKTALDWALIALEARYQEQMRFLSAVPEFKKNGEAHTFTDFRRRPITVAIIASENTEMPRCLLSTIGGEFEIVVKVDSDTGNAQIFSSIKRVSRKLFNIIAILIQRQEMVNRDEALPANLDDLAKDGNNGTVWYYHRRPQMLLNCSLSISDVEPTCLSTAEILNIIKTAITTSINDIPAFAYQQR